MTDTLSRPTSRREGPPSRGDVPGEVGLWFFIVVDLLVFAAFFTAIVIYHGQELDEFRAGQSNLHQAYGMFNTVVLLTSSLLVVIGLRLARRRDPRARRLFIGAMACGATFAAVKAVEYADMIQSGHTVGVSDFYMYYFVFTVIHLGHVAIGVGALAVAVRLARPGVMAPRRNETIEGIACFWHLVDLLWIVLFALLYLVR